MTAIAANASKFLLNTDYELDKVIYLKTDSFTIPTPTAGYYYSVAHGLGFTPLVGGSWSTTSDFSINYDYGTGTIPSSNPSASPFNISLEILADSTNIYIVPTNVSGATKTVYIRIFGLEPSDSTATLSSTESSADSFSLSTDYNYKKLYSGNFISGLTSFTTSIVTHSLGIVPQVSAWATSSSRSLVSGSVFLSNVCYPIYSTYITAGDPNDLSVAVSTSTVTFLIGSGSNVTRVDYRIYYDETGGI